MDTMAEDNPVGEKPIDIADIPPLLLMRET
jgi:hypothetical protein